jgi:hypothetical protein
VPTLETLRVSSYHEVSSETSGYWYHCYDVTIVMTWNIINMTSLCRGLIHLWQLTSS